MTQATGMGAFSSRDRGKHCCFVILLFLILPIFWGGWKPRFLRMTRTAPTANPPPSSSTIARRRTDYSLSGRLGEVGVTPCDRASPSPPKKNAPPASLCAPTKGPVTYGEGGGGTCEFGEPRLKRGGRAAERYLQCTLETGTTYTLHRLNLAPRRPSSLQPVCDYIVHGTTCLV